MPCTMLTLGIHPYKYSPHLCPQVAHSLVNNHINRTIAKLHSGLNNKGLKKHLGIPKIEVTNFA